MEIATNKMKVFGFVGTDHLRTKINLNDEILDQVNKFTYLGCSISYIHSNDIEFKLANFYSWLIILRELFLRKWE